MGVRLLGSGLLLVLTLGVSSSGARAEGPKPKELRIEVRNFEKKAVRMCSIPCKDQKTIRDHLNAMELTNKSCPTYGCTFGHNDFNHDGLPDCLIIAFEDLVANNDWYWGIDIDDHGSSGVDSQTLDCTKDKVVSFTQTKLGPHK